MRFLYPKLPTNYQKNPVRSVDMVGAAFDRFDQFGFCVFEEQLSMYQNLAKKLSGLKVIDVGCGIGVGTSVLSHEGCNVVGTDINPKTLRFAASIHPSLIFRGHDISQSPLPFEADVVVAIEVIEHVANPENVLKNIFSTVQEAYVSSPNRVNPELGQLTPINSFHVQEFTISEFLCMIPDHQVSVRDPKSFETLPFSTTVSPILYHIKA